MFHRLSLLTPLTLHMVVKKTDFGPEVPQTFAWTPGDVQLGPPSPGKTSISVRTSVTQKRGRPLPQVDSKHFGQKSFGLILPS